MNQRDDFVGTYAIGRWDHRHFPSDLFVGGTSLKVMTHGDSSCKLEWKDGDHKKCVLVLGWTDHRGGVLHGRMVEVTGPGIMLEEATVELKPARRLKGRLKMDSVTGGPGTFAAQAPLPPE